MEDLIELGLTIDFTVYDTENNNFKVNQLVDTNDFSKFDFVVGPFVPRHFNTVSENLNERMFFGISTDNKALNHAKNVVHSFTDRKLLRERMHRYIDSLTRKLKILVL